MRACAILGPDGLSPSQIAKNVTGKDGAGVELPKYDMPEAFTFEAEVVPFVAWTNEADRAAAAGSRSMHVFDTMAVNYKPKCRNMGLQVMFHQAGERWTALLYAGLGDMTCRATGPSFTPKAGVPVRLRFEYDALGTVRWDLDGQKQESYLAKAGPIVPDPKHRPVVGDRICSLYWPFNALLAVQRHHPPHRGHAARVRAARAASRRPPRVRARRDERRVRRVGVLPRPRQLDGRHVRD